MMWGWVLDLHISPPSAPIIYHTGLNKTIQISDQIKGKEKAWMNDHFKDFFNL